MKTTKSALWIASGNILKARELVDFGKFYFPQFVEIYLRAPKNVIEDKPTFHGNAKLKAFALTSELLAEGHRNFFVLGDDSGISVDLLNGKPGVRSARYAGDNSTPSENLEKLLNNLAILSGDLDKRSAQYRCSLSLLKVENGKIKNGFIADLSIRFEGHQDLKTIKNLCFLLDPQ